MYTMIDIRDIAVQIERNGEETYRAASKRANDAQFAKLMQWMADEEHRHRKWFEVLPVTPRSSVNHPEMEAMGRALLIDIAKDQTFSLDAEDLDRADNILDLLIQSIGFEKDTILFYDTLKAFIEDDKALKQLEKIIDEERSHIKVLEKLEETFNKGLDVALS